MPFKLSNQQCQSEIYITTVKYKKPLTEVTQTGILHMNGHVQCHTERKQTNLQIFGRAT